MSLENVTVNTAVPLTGLSVHAFLLSSAEFCLSCILHMQMDLPSILPFQNEKMINRMFNIHDDCYV